MKNSRDSDFQRLGVFTLLWIILGLSTSFIPFHQGDDLHYLGAAWAMLQNHEYLSIYHGKSVDLEKTPLFHWLLVLGWKWMGVNNAWPRILTYTIGWINTLLTFFFARQLFPKEKNIAWLAVLILLCSFYWPRFAAEIRFEGLITVFGLLFLNALILASRGKNTLFWPTASIALGFSIFVKGPVSLFYFLPFAFLLPIFIEIESKKIWGLKLLMAIIFSLVIPALWLAYSFVKHGQDAMHYLLLGQVQQRVGWTVSADQLVGLFQGFLAWTIFPLLWLDFIRWKGDADKIQKSLLFCIALGLFFFSFFVELKLYRYLIPYYPLIAIFLASVIVKTRTNFRPYLWLGGIFFIALIAFNINQGWRSSIYQENMKAAAVEMKKLQEQGTPLLQIDNVPGVINFQFLGRFQENMDEANSSDIPVQRKWLAANPEGWVIFTQETPSTCMKSDLSWKIKRNLILMAIPAKNYLSCLQNNAIAPPQYHHKKAGD